MNRAAFYPFVLAQTNAITDTINAIGQNPWLIVIIVILATTGLVRALGKGQNASAESIESLRKFFEDTRKQWDYERGGLNATIQALQNQLDKEREIGETRSRTNTEAITKLEALLMQLRNDQQVLQGRLDLELAEKQEILARLETNAQEMQRLTTERDQLLTMLHERDETIAALTRQLEGAQIQGGD